MQFQFELRPADVIAARRLNQWRRRPLVSCVYTLYGVLLFGWGFSLWQIGSPEFAVIPLVFGAYAGLSLFVISPFLAARKLFSKGKVIRMAITTTPDGVVIATRLTRQTFHWKAFSDFIEGPTVWLLFVNSASYHVIPARAFPSEADKNEFRAQLLRANPELASA